MSGMFWNCLSLADLFPISDWDVANTNRKDMFKGCPSVKTYPKWY